MSTSKNNQKQVKGQIYYGVISTNRLVNNTATTEQSNTETYEIILIQITLLFSTINNVEVARSYVPCFRSTTEKKKNKSASWTIQKPFPQLYWGEGDGLHTPILLACYYATLRDSLSLGASALVDPRFIFFPVQSKIQYLSIYEYTKENRQIDLQTYR